MFVGVVKINQKELEVEVKPATTASQVKRKRKCKCKRRISSTAPLPIYPPSPLLPNSKHRFPLSSSDLLLTREVSSVHIDEVFTLEA